MTEERYIYCFIRLDLPVVQQIVQTAHAADRMALRQENYDPPANLILFQVKDYVELMAVSHFLTKNMIDHEMFYEPDPPRGATGTGVTGYTAIATEPLIGEQRQIMRRFTLYGTPENAEAILEHVT